MKSRHLLKRFRDAFSTGLPARAFENRSIHNQLEEYVLFTSVSILGIGLLCSIWYRFQLNQLALQNLNEQVKLLQQQSQLHQTDK